MKALFLKKSLKNPCRNLTLLILFILAVPTLSSAQDDQDIVITVIRTDTLIGLCELYLNDPDKWPYIARINRLKNPDLIYPGQKILVPSSMLRGIPMEGSVTFLMGDVRWQESSQKKWVTLALNQKVKPGSVIKTGKESAVEITFEDDSSFFLRDNTTLGISYTLRNDPIYIIRQLFLNIGQTISKVKSMTGQENRFEIQTPSAVAGVRGTNFRVSVDKDETTRSESLEGSIIVEAMDKEVRLGKGEGTLVRKGSQPLKPRKLLPPPALVQWEPLYRSLPLKFRFKQLKNAYYYHIVFSKDKHFQDVIKDKLIRPYEVLRFSSLEDGVYFIRSSSIDDIGLEGLYSVPVLIKVRVNPVPPYTLEPVQGDTVKTKSVEFRWLKVEDAVKYHFQIAQDSDFKEIVEDKKTEDNRYETDKLGFKTYFFRVSSIASDGYEGIWSDIIEFSKVPPPPVPQIGIPEVKDNKIQIRWRDLGKGITYHFQMAKDIAFYDILVDTVVSEPTITIDGPKKSGIYYIRTSSIDKDGFEGSFSSTQRLEIKRFPYGVVGAVVSAGGILIILTL